jgi:hypothetical protein
MGVAALRINGGISLIMNKNVETKSPGGWPGLLMFWQWPTPGID